MTMNNDEGGPAFPVVGLHIDDPWSGMPLRDYFAAKAIQGMLAGDSSSESNASLAAFAYQVADAMLRERGK